MFNKQTCTTTGTASQRFSRKMNHCFTVRLSFLFQKEFTDLRYQTCFLSMWGRITVFINAVWWLWRERYSCCFWLNKKDLFKKVSLEGYFHKFVTTIWACPPQKKKLVSWTYSEPCFAILPWLPGWNKNKVFHFALLLLIEKMNKSVQNKTQI